MESCLIDPRRGVDLIKDPVHGYLHFTIPLPDTPDEVTESRLINSRWVQRLRRIRQLQSAYMVYPAADHTRLAHSLGVMELAGRFARAVYERLYRVLRTRGEPPPEDVELVVETFRIAGLLHDVGHGPFSHLFDDAVLDSCTHEDVGCRVIREILADDIRAIRRSPHGSFTGSVDPDIVCSLVSKKADVPKQPYRVLRQILVGAYDADKLDFLLRDALLTGEGGPTPADVARLMETTIATEKWQFCLHASSIPLLRAILGYRLHLFQVVYYHRTARAFEVTLRKHLPQAVAELYPGVVAEADKIDLEAYHSMDEESLSSGARLRAGEGESWAQEFVSVLDRNIPIREAYYRTVSSAKLRPPADRADPAHLTQDLQKRLRKHDLPEDVVRETVVDVPDLETPTNVLANAREPVWQFESYKHAVEPLSLVRLLGIPAQVTTERVYVPKTLPMPGVIEVSQACKSYFEDEGAEQASSF